MASEARTSTARLGIGASDADAAGLNPRLIDVLIRSGPAPVAPVPPAAAVAPTVAPAATPRFAESDSWSGPAGGASRAAFARAARTIPFFVLADAAGLSLCGFLALKLLAIAPVEAAMSSAVAAVALLPLCVIFAFRGLYTQIWTHPIVEFREMANLAAMVLSVAGLASITMPSLAAWYWIAMPLTVAIAPLPRLLIRGALACRHWWGFPTLVVSSGPRAEDAARLLLEVPRSGLRPVLVSDPAGACRGSEWRVINDPALLATMVRSQGIRHAVVSLPRYPADELERLIADYSRLIPHVIVLSNASTLPILWGATRRDGQVSGFVVHNQRLLVTLHRVKRAIDLALTLVALTLALPFLLVAAAAVKLSSPGPIFYGHTRLGCGGRKFKAWKFRSMRTDGDAVLARHLAESPAAREEWARDRKLKNDPRVTRVGDLMRRTSIDELPQFWNVLCGQMSLVGPRPIVADEVNKYQEVYESYSTVKPGITGLWQVSGRSQLTYDERVKLDEFYVQNWSFWLDIYILGKTTVALLARRGAC